MTENEFWIIIDKTKNSKDQSNALREILRAFSVKKVEQLHHIYEDMMAKAYGWHLWGACYTISLGCSDDSFTEFRNWLIAQGKEIYYSGLKDPDGLADIVEILVDERGECWPFISDFDLVFGEIYEKKAGVELPFYSSQPKNPYGEEWKEDYNILKDLYPKIWTKYHKEREL
ncbi:MAG: DUF4240 domain-containing protein [Deltaproteobacteria bacterium]|nr:DUF4240 domain-containing protein [Deltaproteobacteria bacterium]